LAKVRIIEGGPLTTIQDMGQFSLLSRGVPQSGALDSFSLGLANIAVGNPVNTPGLECTLPGLVIEFSERGKICITGGNLQPVIDNEPCPMWETIRVAEGSVLRLAGFNQGCRAYICFAGGIECLSAMSCRSTIIGSGIGGYQGRALKSGDNISVQNYDNSLMIKIPEELRPDFLKIRKIRVVMGPDEELFSQSSLEIFLNAEYKITPQCDRMGYRLEGPFLELSDVLSAYSKGIPLGGIQVTGEGSLIVLLKDRQTVGGYPLIASVISIDLPLFSQLLPGDIIYFEAVSVNSANDLYKKKIFRINQFIKSIEDYPHDRFWPPGR
jgi:antagonist of KipI